MAPTVIILNKVFVPKKLVDIAKIDKLFTKNLYNEAGCSRCPFAPDRPVIECDGCPNFLGALKLWDTKTTNSGKKFVSLPPGDIPRLKRVLDLPESTIWKDKRKLYKFDYPIRFKWQLWDGSVIDGRKTVDQQKLIDQWVERGRSGVIQSPPRSGKTVIAIKGMIDTQCKFIIVAHESRLLKQFYKTIMGSKKEDIKPATNIPFLQRKTGKILCCIVENVQRDLIDNPHLQIGLMNYQKFIKEKSLKSRIKVLNNRFTGLALDESHQSGAMAYLRLVSKFRMRYRMLLSATPFRKDGLDWCTKQFSGPVVAKATTTALTPRIELVETGITSGKYQYRSWVGALKFLANNKERNKLIVRDIFKDFRDGRRGIIIPVDYKNQGIHLVDLINKQARLNREKRKEKWPKTMAAFYSAATKEKGLLEAFDAGKIKVLVSIRSMIKQGIDLTNPDMVYMVIPMSADKTGNAGAPIFRQLSYRPATWTPTKTDPLLRLYIDGIGFSYGCFRGLFWKEILPGLKANKDQPAAYRMNGDDFERAMDIAKMKTYVPPNSPGERIFSKDLVRGKNSKAKEKVGYRKSKYVRNRKD